jgi:hydrogenase/urease accessory protein HupE
MLDGSSSSTILNPTKTSYSVPIKSSNLEVVSTYTWLGITHILMGYDHLAFVFTLLLLVGSVRQLLWTVTSFTIAHSITMAGATLGIVEIPQKPVEAVIALSILFLALEVIHKRDGKYTIASSYPWVVAFIFGLLHGFGFAGALAEIGLPQNAITIALLFFNIGVEIGQLIFIVLVVTIAIALQKLTTPLFIKRVELIAIYIIGTVSSFWLIDRIFSIISLEIS